MNLFLLAAVPLVAVVIHRALYSTRAPFAQPSSWILGGVWSILSLVLAAPLGKMREFDGSLWTASAGLTVTDAVLVPGAVALAWFLTRPRDTWELGLWLALVFTMAGIRDFVATSRVFDMTEFFLVPLDRIFILITLPSVVNLALGALLPWKRIGLWTLAAGLVLTGPAFQVMSFAGWGWLVWVLEAAGLAAGVWWLGQTAEKARANPELG